MFSLALMVVFVMSNNGTFRGLDLQSVSPRFLVQFDFGVAPEDLASVLDTHGVQILDVVRAENTTDHSGPLLQVGLAASIDVPAIEQVSAMLARLPGVTFAERDFDVSIAKSHFGAAATAWTEGLQASINTHSDAFIQTQSAPDVTSVGSSHMDNTAAAVGSDALHSEAVSLKDDGLVAIPS